MKSIKEENSGLLYYVRWFFKDDEITTGNSSIHFGTTLPKWITCA